MLAAPPYLAQFMPTAVSLFSGCGGSDFGLRAAGFEIKMANDILAYARDFYAANLDADVYKLKNICEVEKFPRADLLAGCYPCQGFSQGGVRDPSRSVNYLYREFDRALRAIKPKAFIVENVSGMTRDDNLHLFSNQLMRFRSAGYRVKAKILYATDYGVPQERSRLFFVGIRSNIDAEYEFPSPTHSFDKTPKTLPTPCIRDAIGDMPEWPTYEFDDQPFHWYYLSRNRRRNWNEVSKTIVANSRHVPLHPMSPTLVRLGADNWRFTSGAPARRLSFREAARLQGFPNTVEFPDTMGMRMKYRVIGNAVPPPLFEAVAKAIPKIW